MISPRRPRARRGEGDQLRDEILEVTERLLIETGDVDQVSIRAVASAVGVTAPSIYRHFPDKDTLILEVCSRRFEQLAERITELTEGVTDPLEALAIGGRAYVRFAIENPEYYRIMFMARGSKAPPAFYEMMRTGIPPANDEVSVGEGTPQVPTDVEVFRGVMFAIEWAMEDGKVAPGDSYEMALHVWAQVHGLASLLIAKPGVVWPPLDQFIDDHVTLVVRGLLEPEAGRASGE